MEKGEKVSEFVNLKISLLQQDSSWSKSMLAKLRRGIGKNPVEIPAVWEITMDGLPDELQFKGRVENCSPTEAEWAIFTALTLFSLHKQGDNKAIGSGKKGEGSSFGAAVRRLISLDGSNEVPIKRRFDSIITSNDLSELSYHARGLIQLMRTSTMPIMIDYPQFAKDLYYFQFKEGKNQVKLKWGQDFYFSNEKKNEKNQ